MGRIRGAGTTPRQYRIMRAIKTEGVAPCVLAGRFGTTPAAMRSLIKRLRAKGYDLPKAPRSSRAPSTAILVPRALASRLRRDAKRRGLAPRELIAALLAEIIRRGMTADLLDGGRRDE